MIRHILKDGKVVTDIKGHVVKMEDAKGVYSLIDSINNKPRRGYNGNNKVGAGKP